MTVPSDSPAALEDGLEEPSEQYGYGGIHSQNALANMNGQQPGRRELVDLECVEPALGSDGQSDGLPNGSARAGRGGARVGHQAHCPALQFGQLAFDEGSKVRCQNDFGQSRVTCLFQAQNQLLADRFRAQGSALPEALLDAPRRQQHEFLDSEGRGGVKNSFQNEGARQRHDQCRGQSRRGVAIELQLEFERVAELDNLTGADRTVQEADPEYVAELGFLNVRDVGEATSLQASAFASRVEIVGQEQDQVHPLEDISARAQGPCPLTATVSPATAEFSRGYRRP